MLSRLPALALVACLFAAPAASALSFTTDFRVVNDWGSGFQAELELTNTGTETIIGWTLGFDLARSITSLWNGNYQGVVAGLHTVTDAGWNATLNPGGSFTIGFTGGAGGALATPSTVLLNGVASGESPSVLGPLYEIGFRIVNDWGSGFQAEIEITNVGTDPIAGWSLDFEFARTITSLWNGVYVGASGGVHTVQNAAWNAQILPGGSVVIGFNGAGAGNDAPTDWLLNGYSPVPEPNTVLLVATGLALLGARGRG